MRPTSAVEIGPESMLRHRVAALAGRLVAIAAQHTGSRVACVVRDAMRWRIGKRVLLIPCEVFLLAVLRERAVEV